MVAARGRRLAGHSYGGEVITNAAVGDSQVKALVYDDAYLPAQGESLESLTTARSCFAVQNLSTRGQRHHPGRPGHQLTQVPR